VPVTTTAHDHVLDNDKGRPARRADRASRDWRQRPRLLKEDRHQCDGPPTPMIAGEPLRHRHLRVDVPHGRLFRDYFGGAGFLDIVPIRFSIADPKATTCAVARDAVELYDLPGS